MDKETVLHRIREKGLVAVIRAKSSDQAAKVIDACILGGVDAVEVTLTVPGALQIIGELAGKYRDGSVLIGAGTVLDAQTARGAILAGASFIVSPCLDADTVRLCGQYRVACMPGAMTVREVVECMRAGADIVKIFPGELFGPQIIKSFLGPLPHAQLMPTGGVSVGNAAEWIRAGAVALGAGGSLTAGAASGDYPSVTDTAVRFLDEIRMARENRAK